MTDKKTDERDEAPNEFLPKLVTVLREGYSARDFQADVLAGLTVAIVALPLSMAIAIASGVGPERGLYTTIIGGFLVSALGGSRYQVGGPAGAFIVLVSACVMQIGIEGLILATFLSGLLLVLAGLLRLGTYIKFIPYPVTVGFTAGIAVIIFASQMKDLFGLSLAGPEPAEILHKVGTLWGARGTATPAAFGVAIGTIALILGVKRLRPGWPNLLIAIVTAAVVVALTGLPVETIGSRFGDLPRLPPSPSLPQISFDAVMQALPYAVSFTLLGAIESLLSAVVADGMSGRQHRSNIELVAQGIANVGTSLFGGFCVTGTIARTATNVRAGSRGPVSGMLHALFVLGFMLVAAPLAAFIPLAALAGLLAVVAWNMAEKEEFWTLVKSSKGDAMVVIVTFLLVVFRDLTEGIVVGFALGGLVFIRRMSDAAEVETAQDEQAKTSGGVDRDRVVYRLHGPYFFGAAARLGVVLDRIADYPRAFVVDFSDVPFIDSSGARSFELLAHKVARKGGQLYLVAARPEVRRTLLAQGAREPLVRFVSDLGDVDAAEAAR
ncbi:MAG: SulP family inorganic anion transporter [Pseudotabrizicola sp.]|uniref:SulP family inorganic anion transporter n=1 Tax=Pseudotabrizicola sp. TaxID=2939647 RepID=UPI0027309724|nr:SulP family inorganic anion transporter [Pseudotabrizicola sp.]MDP2080090.1 SulP family inorganic anion transporter [Pseudotabrizicola sp.]MDZ7575536.1 SulP family inorganic anion transporter [Pseudotabrizicola sp.]